MKEFLDKVVKAEFGHILLFGTIDAVDDTVAVKKSLISGLLKDLDNLMDDKYAKKVIFQSFPTFLHVPSKNVKFPKITMKSTKTKF